MYKNYRFLIIALSFSLIITGCEKKDDQIVREKEVMDQIQDKSIEQEKSVQNTDVPGQKKIDNIKQADLEIPASIQTPGNWEKIEGSYADTFELCVGNLAQIAADDYLYYISTEEELTHILYNTGPISEEQEWEKLITDHPIEEYDYIVFCGKYAWDASHHVDYIEYDSDSNDIRFHYDSWIEPEFRIVGVQEWRIYLDIAIVPKAFFDGKNISRLLSPQELDEMEYKLRENVRLVE